MSSSETPELVQNGETASEAEQKPTESTAPVQPDTHNADGKQAADQSTQSTENRYF